MAAEVAARSRGLALSETLRRQAGEELARRLPRLLFAALDHFPLVGSPRGPRQHEVEEEQRDGEGRRRLACIAVRSLAAGARLDARAIEDIEQLAAGARRPCKQEAARKVQVELCGEDGTELTLSVHWHDCVDFWRLTAKGAPSCTEAIAGTDSDSVLLTTPEWQALRHRVSETVAASPRSLLRGEAYLRACSGAAMAALRTGSGADRPVSPSIASAVAALCDRLAGAEGQGRGPTPPATAAAWRAEVERLAAGRGPEGGEAPGPSAAGVDAVLRGWCAELRAAEFEAFREANEGSELMVGQPLNDWSRHLQQRGFPLAAMPPPPPPPSSALEEADGVVELLAGQLPERARVVFMAQVGSYMYDLHTESSDRDFRIIFVAPTEEVLGLDPPKAEFNHHVNKGFAADKHGEVEYSGQELGEFVIELAKGNPRNIEILFSAKPFVSAWPWEELRAARTCFLTLRCAAQYLGFVSDRLHRLANIVKEPAPLDAARAAEASKLLYHAHHKMCDLRRILRGEAPAVALSGAERERIMALRLRRAGSLEELAGLLEAAREEKRALGDELDRARGAGGGAALLPAEVDAAALAAWLRSVRVRALHGAAASVHGGGHGEVGTP